MSSLVPSNSFIFTNTNRRNHNKIPQFNKLVVFAAASLSTAESLDLKENPRSLQAQRFVDRIKASPLKERIDIFDSIKKDGTNWSVSDFNDLLMALVMLNEQETAVKFFSEASSYGLAPNSWTFSIMIRCYCNKNDFFEARKVIDCMFDNGYHPNVTTFTILVNSLCKSGRLKEALEVLDQMGRIGCKPNIQTYNCLLKGLCYVGRVEEAYEMLMNVKNDGLKPDVYTYTAVMDGFCKVGRSNEAMELLNEAIERGVTPNVVTFNTLFNGYCKEGTPMKGVGLLKLMKKRNCLPDKISYSTLLNGLLKWGKIRPAVSIFKEMVRFGFEVDERMMNSLLRGLCMKSWEEKDLLEDAYQVFEKMTKKVSVTDPGTYGIVIRTLGKGKKTDEALIHLHHAIEMGHIPRTITFNNVIQALCGEGKIDKALLLLFLMYEHAKIPSRTSYDMLITKLDQLEKSYDACALYGAALKQGVIPQRKPQD
ncbi:hypothetical protein CISIN_1g011714mg [Citrus sinensis]|uniref:PROP1-like PPR domain-containing protein n=1 Tax=Citrus sinensis TaxID=2711 RepID=A0A067FD76_CITSI|nr:hypothetical protein CISIN_1g011714mg [Citrus sinensis]